MELADNKLHPLEIQDARTAAHRASELQREVEDQIKRDARALADAERAYRKALSVRIVELRTRREGDRRPPLQARRCRGRPRGDAPAGLPPRRRP
jgi:hypothetical protein